MASFSILKRLKKLRKKLASMEPSNKICGKRKCGKSERALQQLQGLFCIWGEKSGAPLPAVATPCFAFSISFQPNNR
jgi:hypothetical protein